MGSFQKFCLRWNNHSSNFVGNLGSLLESEEYSDVTVCCEGQVWHLHQLVLSASSGHFAHLLGLIPANQTPILILDGPPANDVQALIQFIYHGEVNVDQEALPSLLRTASSFRIKGLADVNPMSCGIVRNDCSQTCDEILPPSVSVESLTPTVIPEQLNYEEEDEDVTPLNLSCNNKNVSLERKCLQNPSNVVPTVTEDTFNPPPSKKIRILEPRMSIVTSKGSNGTILSPYVTVKSESRTPKTETVKSLNGFQTQKEEKETPLEYACPPQIKLVDQSLKEAPTFVNISSKVTFPILKLALSPQLAYQPSSTTLSNAEVVSSAFKEQNPSKSPEYNSTSGSKIDDGKTEIPNIYKEMINGATAQNDFSSDCKENQESKGRIILQPPANSYISQPMLATSTRQEPSREYKLETLSELKPSTQYVNAHSPSGIVQETTFTHKKFSVCTIPHSTTPKTVHLVRSSYNTNTLPSNCYRENDTNEVVGSQSAEPSRSSSLDDPQSEDGQNGKLTPVSVTSFSPIKYPTNSVICSASVDSQVNDTSVISSSSPVISENISLVPLQSAATKDEEQTSPYLQSLFRQVGSNEITENTSTSQPFVGNSITSSADGANTTTTTPAAQRVTINMRTFKEEWRKQLLVDYDSNTNMSICMLCFTTFKSYDGPRKNTYVKHAKRFHPALEEYSEEERGVIISMYEKYHKYDIDMQKEINKSFRTTNSSGAALKRMRAAESMQILHHPVGGTSALAANHSDTDPESSDPKGDSATESNLRYSSQSSPSSSEAESIPKKVIGATRSPEHDPEFPNINNNDKSNRNKNEPQQSDEENIKS